MVALSKLLVGALIQSVYGKQVLDKPKPAKSSALLESPVATITQQECKYDDKHGFGNLTINVFKKAPNCTVNGVAIKDAKLHIRVNCTETDNQIYTVKNNTLRLGPEITIFNMSEDNRTIVVGKNETFKPSECIMVKLPNQGNTVGKHYQIRIPKFTPGDMSGDGEYGKLASLVTPEGDVVEKSAFFGTNGGELDLLDLVGIAAACVLVCCLGLALYGCWSKKQKQEAEQRQTKYVAQNSNPSGRTGTQRRRR